MPENNYPNVAIYEQKSLLYVISYNNKIQTYVYLDLNRERERFKSLRTSHNQTI